jgi:hypothetical protein
MLKFGVIGISEGNGHPYSWSAICNGYDVGAMQLCPFPVIPQYLAEQTWPEARLKGVHVTHVWTQDEKQSIFIAKAAKIDHVVSDPIEMIGKIDGLLLARDDAARHPEMALPFLKAGLPVFVDKPFALSTSDADTMWAAQQREGQIFTCSSLRFASELELSAAERVKLGEIKWVEASIMKKWDTYAIHLLEPLITQVLNRGEWQEVHRVSYGEIGMYTIKWDNLLAYLKVTGSITSPLALTYYGSKGSVTKSFTDSFGCFKNSLARFRDVVLGKVENIPMAETRELVNIIEAGRT